MPSADRRFPDQPPIWLGLGCTADLPSVTPRPRPPSALLHLLWAGSPGSTSGLVTGAACRGGGRTSRLFCSSPPCGLALKSTVSWDRKPESLPRHRLLGVLFFWVPDTLPSRGSQSQGTEVARYHQPWSTTAPYCPSVARLPGWLNSPRSRPSSWGASYTPPRLQTPGCFSLDALLQSQSACT